MGSKARISKHLLPIILKNRKPDQWYVEPFVGGGNMIEKVEGKRFGSDSNKYAVRALEFVRDCTPPKNNTEFTEDDYAAACEYARGRTGAPPFGDGLAGFALFAYSFGAKWCGGWSRGKNSAGDQRDYVQEQYKAALKQKPLISGVPFYVCSYDELEIPKNSIIYCDPPYAKTTRYKDKFDHERFWSWCRDMVKQGQSVFVSEYSAPNDFVCLWSQQLTVTVAKDGRQKKAVERLFIHQSQADAIK